MNHRPRENVKGPADPTSDPGVAARTLEAARRLFAERGYAGASIRDVAAEVGVTVPALYYHFGSKRGILVALVEDHLRRRRGAVEQALAAPDTVLARLSGGLSAYMDFMARESGTYLIVMHDPNLFADAELRAAVRSIERQILARFTEVVEQGVQTGEFRPVDPEQTGLLLLTAARAVHLARCFWATPAEVEEGRAGRATPAADTPDRTLVAGCAIAQPATDGWNQAMLELLLHGLVVPSNPPGGGLPA